ncbi:MAG: HAMP domain-containing protein [Planctomycetes bacterium]|nr:HAMP domain-containing protein [Planctomycetota bacterium]
MRLFGSLRSKIIGSFIALTLLLGMVTIWLVYSQVNGNSKDALIRKGRGITQAMVESSRHLILTDNTFRLQELVDTLKLSDNEINYIYITDRYSMPIVHTFKQNIPDDLLKLSVSYNSSQFKYFYLKADNDFIHHIIMPIDDGKVGFISLGLSDSHRRQRIGIILSNIIVVALFCLIVGVIGAYILSSIITRSLGKLTRAVSKVGQGDFNVKVDIPSGHDEISELARTFNKMSEDLKQYVNRLNDSENNLKRAQQMAVVGQMCAGLAHEINNPLDGIQRSVEVIRKTPGDNKTNETLFVLISDGLKRIENTIRQLLAYARYQPNFGPVDINSIIQDVFRLMEPRIKENEIEVVMQPDKALPLLSADRNGMFQVISNLLSNALDILPKKGKIIIRTSWRPADNIAEVSFEDNGPGITEGIKKRIFEPFFTTKEMGKGTGLGLFISKSIIEQHQGSIRVESAVGKGSCFIIELPLKGHRN